MDPEPIKDQISHENIRIFITLINGNIYIIFFREDILNQ